VRALMSGIDHGTELGVTRDRPNEAVKGALTYEGFNPEAGGER
jgi:hypothetical protein